MRITSFLSKAGPIGKIVLFAFLMLTAVMFAACAGIDPDKNNDRSIKDLMAHMIRNVGGTFAGNMFVPPVKAVEGVSIALEGKEVAFYKYDLTLKKQRNKVEHIRKTGQLYINGVRFEAEVNGSFVMINHAVNLKKAELIKAFQKF
ncbi:MAG: hypothetical protein J6W81_01320 [Lentisphaeria bacterium]|nr:hypothetical protein [Lentisphaeria bacterium]